MASIGSLLKEEITRLSRKEIRRQVEPYRKASTTHRKHIAALKRQIAVLTKQVKAAGKGRTRVAEAPAETTSNRFVAKGLKTLRARLGLSAADLGKLLGVSGQSVYNWENKKAVPRRAQVAAIAALRSKGKREVQAELDPEGGAVSAAKPAATTRKSASKRAGAKKSVAKKSGARKTASKSPATRRAAGKTSARERVAKK